MSHMLKVLFTTQLALLICLPSPLWAGFIEVGGSANYRKSALDKNNYQEAISYTASLSYYFWEMSALELSYTNGYSNLVIKPQGEPRTTTETNFQMIGLDIVFSLASREDVVQPYMKLGSAYVHKEIFRQVEGNDKTRIGTQSGIVPSAGAGVKVAFTKELGLRTGIDAWTSPLSEEPLIIDYAARAGITWMF